MARPLLRPVVHLPELEEEEQAFLLENARRSANWPPWRKALNTFVANSKVLRIVSNVAAQSSTVVIALSSLPALRRSAPQVDIVEAVLLFVYIAELLLRIVALGLRGCFSIRRNIYDACVLAVGLYGFIISRVAPTYGHGEMSVLAFRTLGVVTSHPALWNITKSLRASLPRLADVLALAVLIAAALTVVGVEFFQDVMDHRCYSRSDAVAWAANGSGGQGPVGWGTDNQRACRLSGAVSTSMPVEGDEQTDLPGARSARENEFGNASFDLDSFLMENPLTVGYVVPRSALPPTVEGHVCEFESYCLPSGSPGHGLTNFDNFGTAFAALYTMMALDSWAVIVRFLMDGVGFAAAWYEVIVYFIGSIFLLNLVVVMLVESFKHRSTHSSGHHQPPSATAVLAKYWRSLLRMAFDRVALPLTLRKARIFVGKKLVRTPILTIFTIVVIVADTVALCTTYYGMSQAHYDVVDAVDLACMALLVLEVCIRLFGTPWTFFFCDPGSLFDLAVTSVSTCQVFSPASGLAVLKSLRMLRLIPAIRPLRQTIRSIGKGIRASLWLLFFFALVMFLYTLVGIQAFAGTLCGLDTEGLGRIETSLCRDVPRLNFDSMGGAFLSVLVVVVGEGWRELLSTVAYRTKGFAYIYFFSLAIFGLIGIHLVLAILLDSAARVKTEKAVGEDLDEAMFARSEKKMKLLRFNDELPGDEMLEALEPSLLEHSGEREDRLEPREMRDLRAGPAPPPLLTTRSNGFAPVVAPGTPQRDVVAFYSDEKLRNQQGTVSFESVDVEFEELIQEGEAQEVLHEGAVAQVRRWRERRFAEEMKRPLIRRVAAIVARHWLFPWAISASVLFSTAALTVSENKIAPDEPRHRVAAVADIVCAALFTFEAAIKMLHRGFFRPKRGDREQTGNVETSFSAAALFIDSRGGYFNSAWNCFDFAITLVSWSSVLVLPFSAAIGPSYGSVRRWLRVPRVLRIFSVSVYIRPMRLLVAAVLHALPLLRDVGVIAVVFWVLFSQIALLQFSGRFHACTSEVWGDKSYDPPFLLNQSSCLAANFSWSSSPSNFDDMGNSLMTWFQVATTSEWWNVMFVATDASTDDVAPQYNSKAWAPLLFIAFIFTVTIFMLAFINTALVGSYFEAKEKMEFRLRHTLRFGEADALTEEQSLFFHMVRRAAYYVRPPLVVTYLPGTCRHGLRRLVRSPAWNYAVFGLACAHIIVTAATHAGESRSFRWALFDVDVVFTAFFVVAMAMKVAVYGPAFFVSTVGNLLDLVTNIVTAAGVITVFVAGDVIFAARICLLFRILRVHRLLSISPRLAVLIRTLHHSLVSVISLTAFLAMMGIAFAVLGMRLFGSTKYESTDFLAFNGYINFDIFPSALFTVFRASTADMWPPLMHNGALHAPHCDPNIGDCGVPGWSQLFFGLAIVAIEFLGMPLLVAVVMESFEKADRDARFVIQEDDVLRFRRLWKKFTSIHNNYAAMNIVQLSRFVVALGEPMSTNFKCHTNDPAKNFSKLAHLGAVDVREVLRYLCKLDLPTFGVHALVTQDAVFSALLRFHYGVPLPREASAELDALLALRFRRSAVLEMHGGTVFHFLVAEDDEDPNETGAELDRRSAMTTLSSLAVRHHSTTGSVFQQSPVESSPAKFPTQLSPTLRHAASALLVQALYRGHLCRRVLKHENPFP